MKPVDSFAFRKLRSEIESFPRCCGHYIIDLVSISQERLSGWSQEQILDMVFQYFDEEQWPPESERPSDQSWERDYVVDESVARARVIEQLIGGRTIGQVGDIMSSTKATEFWDRFCEFFTSDRKHYVAMGLGDSTYVFQEGAAIVDFDRAGILWVVESD